MTPSPNPSGKHALLPGQNPDGKYMLTVLLKRTYRIVPFSLCERTEDRPLLGGDKHYADPMNSTVRFESDFIPFKLATDVVLNGTAYAPGGRAVREFTATLEVGTGKKQVRVIGDRVCKHRPGGDPVFGDPRPFTQMPLRYERAYGGVDVDSEPRAQFAYPRNHLGKGFVIENVKGAIDGLELPNLEDPADPLTPARLCCGRVADWAKQPVPTGFGWYSKFWQPRAGWAGILPGDRAAEQMMRNAYAAFVPQPMREAYLANPLPTVEFRFFNGASPGLSVPYLRGDEAVQLTNLTPDGSLVFILPGDRPAIALDIGAGRKEGIVVLQTVMIRLDEGGVDLVWRAAFDYPGPDWLSEMKKAEITIHG